MALLHQLPPSLWVNHQLMLVIPHYISYQDSDGNFPAGPVVKNLPTNAGDMGWIHSWTRKIQHAVEQLSTCAITTEPGVLEPRLCSKRSSSNPQLEKASVQQLRPSTAKNKFKKKVQIDPSKSFPRINQYLTVRKA